MHVIQLIGIDAWCGSGQYALDLARGLAAAGHRSEVICRPAAAVVERLVGGGQAPVAKLSLRGAFDAMSAVRLSSTLRRCDEAIVHVHTLDDAIVAVRARELSCNPRVGVVLTLNVAPAAAVARQLLPKLDALVFTTSAARGDYLAANPFFPGSKAHVVATTTPLRRCASAAPAADGPAGPAGSAVPTVVWHGRIVAERGLAVLLEALAQVADMPWRLLIAGEGKAQHVGPLKQQARRLGLADRTEWLGQRSDIAALLGRADVGVAVSTGRDTFGMAALESLAAGVATIVSTALPVAALLRGGAEALMVGPGDPDALAAALRALLGDPALRRSLAAAGAQAIAQRLPYPAMLAGVCAVYQSVRKIKP